MKRYVKRMVKSLGNPAPLEFPTAEFMALIIWLVSYSIFYNIFHIIIAVMLSTTLTIPFFILLKNYIKSNKCKQEKIDIDIIRQFDLDKRKTVEVSLYSISNFDAKLFNYAVQTLIDLQLLKFYAELAEDGTKVIVSIQDEKGNVISKRTFYSITDFQQIFSPKKNA